MSKDKEGMLTRIMNKLIFLISENNVNVEKRPELFNQNEGLIRAVNEIKRERESLIHTASHLDRATATRNNTIKFKKR